MSVKINDAFEIEAIELKDFNFRQHSQIKASEHIQFELNQKIEAQYNHTPSIGAAIVALRVAISITQDENKIYTVSGVIVGSIKLIERNENLLKNFAAILYSYFRPLVAQVTVFAKLPPLDLPPMNFTELNITNLDDLESIEDNT